jgi:TRAP-type uncharacterized transport system fused permease subunit
MKQGGHLLIPIILLFSLIFMNYSLARAAMLSIAATFFVSLIRKKTRMGFEQIKNAFQEAGFDMLMLLAAGATAGIILGVVWLTGLGLKFSSFFLDVAGQNLFLMLCLIAIVSLIFGMGLPVVASYIVLATLAGPALEQLSVPPIVAHLVVFWFSVDALVTPPVAMASYVAAGIAKAPIMPTAMESWKAAKALYIVPFLMVYGPLITGDIFQKIEVFLMALCGFFAMTASYKGFLLKPALIPERALLALAALLLFLPGDKSYMPLTHVSGLILFVSLMFVNKMIFFDYRERKNEI